MILFLVTLLGFWWRTSQGPPSGQVGILLVEGGQETPVDVDHRFQTGDRLRFVLNPEQGGWLYVYHQGPQDQEPSRLWPTPDTGIEIRFSAGDQIYVPPSGRLLEFADTTGKEKFFFGICETPNCIEEDGAPATRQRLDELAAATERNVKMVYEADVKRSVKKHEFVATEDQLPGAAAVLEVDLLHEQ